MGVQPEQEGMVHGHWLNSKLMCRCLYYSTSVNHWILHEPMVQNTSFNVITYCIAKDPTEMFAQHFAQKLRGIPGPTFHYIFFQEAKNVIWLKF